MRTGWPSPAITRRPAARTAGGSSQLTESYELGENPAAIVRFPESLKLLTRGSVQAAAKTYFNTKRYVQVTLYPEKH